MAALQCFVAVIDWPDGMVFIPPGKVTIRDDKATGVVELPGFFIDRTEVTVGLFRRFCSKANWRHPPQLDSAPADVPVTMVTYYDALAFAAQQGKQLPTEAQWARAAYGEKGVSELFPWGDTWRPGAANVKGTQDGFEGLAPVASFADDCSTFGCLDMAGNAQEWTRSADRPLPYDTDDGREDIEDLFFGSAIALRGGHCDMPVSPLAARHSAAYESAHKHLGFRCVRPLPTSLDQLEALL